jgi:hypothetical protein
MRKSKLTIPLLALLLLAACSTIYTGVVTMTTVVDTAMKSWADLSVKNLTTPAIDSQVVTAHNKYRTAAGVAQGALQAYKLSGDPAQYNAAMDAAKAAANQLLDIIVPLLSPAQATDLKKKLTNAKTI